MVVRRCHSDIPFTPSKIRLLLEQCFGAIFAYNQQVGAFNKYDRDAILAPRERD